LENRLKQSGSKKRPLPQVRQRCGEVFRTQAIQCPGLPCRFLQRTEGRPSRRGLRPVYTRRSGLECPWFRQAEGLRLQRASKFLTPQLKNVLKREQVVIPECHCRESSASVFLDSRQRHAGMTALLRADRLFR